MRATMSDHLSRRLSPPLAATTNDLSRCVIGRYEVFSLAAQVAELADARDSKARVTAFKTPRIFDSCEFDPRSGHRLSALTPVVPV